MRVLDHEQHGGPLRGEEDAICERAQGQFLALQSGKIGQFGARRPNRATGARHRPAGRRPRILHICAMQAVELFGARRRIVIRSEANRAAQPLDDRIKRGRRMIGRALQADGLVRLILHTLDQRFQQAGLSYPRLAAHKHRLALAALGEFPPVEEDADFAVAPHELRERPAARRVKAAFDLAFAGDAEHRHAMREAFELAGAKSFEFESVAGQAAGIVRDQDLPRLGGALKARSEIGRLARHLASVEHAASGKIADDHAAARDADARLKRRASGRLEAPDPRNRRKTGADRALGVIFIGHRPPEIGEHAVAKKLRHVAAKPLDRACDGFLVGADEVMHLLRVEPSR